MKWINTLDNAKIFLNDKYSTEELFVIRKYFSNQHPFHLVTPSPWPILVSFNALSLTISAVCYFHFISHSLYILIFSIFLLIFNMFNWWRDVIRESTFEGRHTKQVQQGLKIGMVLFIISEIMFFFAFFWAFFHSSLVPTIWIGCVWPPKGIDVFNPWQIPFTNTLILLLSGATITWSHYSLLNQNRNHSIYSLILTIFLGGFFTILQIYEYKTAPFNISDGIYASTFYLSTGFHGFHVLVGTTFLFVCLIRLIKHHFTPLHHLGFEFAAWYWHFVDVVWLFLFISIYIWGGSY